jgi:hypothetical protein
MINVDEKKKEIFDQLNKIVEEDDLKKDDTQNHRITKE